MGAFLWSLLSPFTAGAILYVLGEAGIDIDDLLPRAGAIAVMASIGIGIPLSGVVLGFAAAARAQTQAQRWLCRAAMFVGCLWAAAAGGLLMLAVRA